MATVDEEYGSVELKGVGTACITATEIADNYEPASASYLLKVEPGDGNTIKFQSDSITKNAGESFQVKVDGDDEGVISYRSDRDTVATISGTGLVTAIASGIAKITVRKRLDNYKDATDELTLTVN